VKKNIIKILKKYTVTVDNWNDVVLKKDFEKAAEEIEKLYKKLNSNEPPNPKELELKVNRTSNNEDKWKGLK